MICRKEKLSSRQIFQVLLTKYWYITRISQTGKTKSLNLFVKKNMQHPLQIGVIYRSA